MKHRLENIGLLLKLKKKKKKVKTYDWSSNYHPSLILALDFLNFSILTPKFFKCLILAIVVTIPFKIDEKIMCLSPEW